MTVDVLTALRDRVQEDVADRGLRTDPDDNLITACPDDFAGACKSIAAIDKPKLLVVTGFFIADAEPPGPETDGPLGALYLARALVPLGVDVFIATDPPCVKAVESGLEVCHLQDAVRVLELPQEAWDHTHYEDWVLGRTDRHNSPLTHIVALERVGPSHTPLSVKSQRGGTAALAADFQKKIPEALHDRCWSMRGRDITDHTSPAHLLIEAASRQEPPVTTIGIGDGGNEIGMGKVRWDVLGRNVPGGALIGCRVPTDYLVVAGVSNWGAYALAQGVRWLRQAPAEPELFDIDRERHLLEVMVDFGPLVDGVTKKREATVDGLPFDRYAAVLPRIAELVGGAPPSA